MLSVTRVPPTYCRALCAFKQAFRYDPNFRSSRYIVTEEFLEPIFG